MAITVKEAQTLYVSYFGRPADFVGLQYWTGTETLVGSLEQLAHSFYNSAEGKKYFPVDPATNQIDVTASINAIYANMFGRVPETAGFDYWYNEIASGKINLAEAAVAIYKGAQGKDALMVENKIAAATQFTDQVAASDKPSLYYGDQAFAKANEFLNTVTDTTDVTSAGFAAQVNAAVNASEAAGAVAGEGGTFTLTANATNGILTNEVNVDFTPEGKYLTAGNDVIDLSEWTGSGNVTIGDAFSGDNDKVTVMADKLADPVANPKLKLTSIENLEIVNSIPKTSVALNSTNFKGLEAIKLIGDGTTLNVSGLTQGVKVDATADADHITGSDKADTINGGAGNDTIVGNDGDDVLTGGNGADTFVVGTVKAAGVDQILDFSAEDKISMAITSTMPSFTPGELKKFDASTFSTVTYKTLDSVLATFGSGGANVTGSGDVVIFSYDGKTYALLANGPFTETGSALVDITGANVASLTESNFGDAIDPTPVPPAPPVVPYSNYAEFVNAVAFGTIPAGKLAEISTLTGPEAGMLAVNKAYLDKIAAGGIKNVTGDIVVTVSKTGEASDNFDSAAFANKLADSIVKSDIVMNITGTDKDDVIIATFGGEINGSGGKNVITANAAATINGGDNVDTIYVNAGGSVNGGSGDDKIYVSGSANATINGGSGADIIDASAATGAVTITGGSGADVIILGAGADVVTYSAAGETAKVSSTATAKANIITTAASAASSADTIYNVKVGDKIDISAVAGSSAALVSSGNVIKSDGIGSVTLTTSADVLLIKDNADYFLVYENSGTVGTTDSLGANAEVIKLVGLTDTSKITLDGGIVTITA